MLGKLRGFSRVLPPQAWFAIVAAAATVLGGLSVVESDTRSPPPGDLATFASLADLLAYVNGSGRGGGAHTVASDGSFLGLFGTLSGGASSAGPEAPGYTGTNVQVEGVDELDLVKTDGTYLYAASNEGVTILLAYPASGLRVVSRIPIGEQDPNRSAYDGPQVAGLFVHDDLLVVVYSPSLGYWHSYYGAWSAQGVTTTVDVYDIRRREAPVLAAHYGVSGVPVTGRLVNDVVYLIANAAAYSQSQADTRPTVCDQGRCAALSLERIYYDPQAKYIAGYSTVLSIDLVSGRQETTAVLSGTSSVVYMSRETLYLTFPKWTERVEPARSWGTPAVVSEEWTTVHKLRVEGTSVAPAASGTVPGRLLNQFSLDEYDGYLRVATTQGQAWGGTSRNHVYVLDGELDVAGRLEGLAPGETIHSARFLGDRAYLVTFKKIDPFFVIDLADPRAPKVLGYLKIPGFSDYLHPIGENHVLGVGKDAYDMDSFAWFQGLKLSLFDVTDVEHPVEVDKVVIGNRGTDSEVLRDHKAFLYVPGDGTLVLPVQLYESDSDEPSDYGRFVWEGAYVYTVTAENGFAYRGRIAHAAVEPHDYSYYYESSMYAIRRSFVIGETLYTVSPAAVKANRLADLAEVKFLVYDANPSWPTRGWGTATP